LPAACLQTGAIIAGAPEKDTTLLYVRFGENIGMAFQIKDDWLDCFGDEETVWKEYPEATSLQIKRHGFILNLLTLPIQKQLQVHCVMHLPTVFPILMRKSMW
jgi:geranylgeranyl pyrophosphate synthase